jgi:hypothetical protein
VFLVDLGQDHGNGCRIVSADPPYKINFTTEYNSEPNQFDAFVQLDSSSQGSLWWGAELLSMWFQALRTQMAHSESPAHVSYDWLYVTLWFDNSKDITDMDFISFLGSYARNGTFNWLGGIQNVSSLSVWNNTNIQPYLPQQIDGFAKSLYSTVLVDLGQQEGPNILTNPDQPQHYLAASFDVDRNTDTAGNYTLSTYWHTGPVTASQSYKTLNSTGSGMGRLSVTPSQIYAQYVCQVPSIKSAGSLIWSIIIGDLVLLQAIWKVFIWTVDLWLTNKDKSAMLCDGCVEKKDPYEVEKVRDDRSESDPSDHLVAGP